MNNEFSDTYWNTSHKGYDFGESEFPSSGGSSKLSAVMRNDDLNQLDLLRFDGLTEAVENSSPKDFIPFNISLAEEEKQASKLAKNFNPLNITRKIPKENIKYGPDETVKNMILGSEYSLTGFKGKKQKIELLKAAVKTHDGNAILEVVLFMRNTLKKLIFQREIVNYPDAVSVYLAYLEEDHETDELDNMLQLLNRAEDASIVKYEAAVAVESPERKFRCIENCLSTHFQIEVTDSFLRQSVEEHKQLLEEQIKLEMYNQAHHTDEIDESKSLFQRLTGKKSVVDSSILCSLIFCCLHDYNVGELNFACPEKIKTNYNLSKKQYSWAALRALAARHKWNHIDELFTSKTWLRGTKVRSCIPYSKVLEVLSREKAPVEILKKYVACVENEEEKLMLAKKYACHSVAIEVFKYNKDRVGLMNYTAALLPHSIDYNYATETLKNPAIRWKN